MDEFVRIQKFISVARCHEQNLPDVQPPTVDVQTLGGQVVAEPSALGWTVQVAVPG